MADGVQVAESAARRYMVLRPHLDERQRRHPDGLPVRSYQNLLAHLHTLNRETINFAGQRIQKITEPTPTQRRAFALIGTPIPLTLADK